MLLAALVIVVGVAALARPLLSSRAPSRSRPMLPHLPRLVSPTEGVGQDRQIDRGPFLAGDQQPRPAAARGPRGDQHLTGGDAVTLKVIPEGARRVAEPGGGTAPSTMLRTWQPGPPVR